MVHVWSIRLAANKWAEMQYSPFYSLYIRILSFSNNIITCMLLFVYKSQNLCGWCPGELEPLCNTCLTHVLCVLHVLHLWRSLWKKKPEEKTYQYTLDWNHNTEAQKVWLRRARVALLHVTTSTKLMHLKRLSYGRMHFYWGGDGFILLFVVVNLCRRQYVGLTWLAE